MYSILHYEECTKDGYLRVEECLSRVLILVHWAIYASPERSGAPTLRSEAPDLVLSRLGSARLGSAQSGSAKLGRAEPSRAAVSRLSHGSVLHLDFLCCHFIFKQLYPFWALSTVENGSSAQRTAQALKTLSLEAQRQPQASNVKSPSL